MATTQTPHNGSVSPETLEAIAASMTFHNPAHHGPKVRVKGDEPPFDCALLQYWLESRKRQRRQCGGVPSRLA